MRTVLYLMTAIMSVTSVWLFFGVMTSCHAPSPVEPDVVITETGPGGSCMTSAERLHELGCPEAADAGAFAQVCQHVVDSRLEAIDVRCMTAATSKEAARTCPRVTCR